MNLNEPHSRYKDYPTAQKLGLAMLPYVEYWQAGAPVCSQQDFETFVMALGKTVFDPGMYDTLYFLAGSATDPADRKARVDRILERRLRKEVSQLVAPDVVARDHDQRCQAPIGTLRQTAADTLRQCFTPDDLPTEEECAGGLQTITARDLQDKEFDPVRWVVEGLLPQGLALLVSPPKYGKSWFMLDLCLSVAAGDKFLNMPTHKMDCFYLALEDNQRRLQDRMNKVLQGERAPAGFAFATAAGDIGNGLIDQLAAYLDGHPDCGLVVIDTLQKVRRAKNGSASAYEADYKDIGALQKFATERNICLLLVHHLRKMKDETDPFNQISGTNGILGAADSALVMNRRSRADDTTTLAVTGRDLESCDLALRFDKALCRWQNLGNADALAREQARRAYESSALVETIRRLVKANHGTWSGSAKDLMDAGKVLTHRFIAESPRALSNRLKMLERDLTAYDNIEHEYVKRGSSGGVHHFHVTTAQQDIHEADARKIA